MPDTPLLDQVHLPADTRGFDIPQLRQLADELRAETIDAMVRCLKNGAGFVDFTIMVPRLCFRTPSEIQNCLSHQAQQPAQAGNYRRRLCARLM